MFTKLFVTAAAAAAVSVPLAGVAWADQPTDPRCGGRGCARSDWRGSGWAGNPYSSGHADPRRTGVRTRQRFQELADFLQSFAPGGPRSPGDTISDFAHGTFPGPPA
jgi:hypothetical protein